MALSERQLRRELREAGIANAAINAIWPEWWSAEAGDSLSATTELTYTVARRLGLSPRSLFDGSPQFLWHDSTKFKNLGTTTDREQAILASFGTAVGRCAISATLPSVSSITDAQSVRDAILAQAKFVGLPELLTFCWRTGIPVIQLRVFPLLQKRMQAMTVKVKERYAILLGYESEYYARMAYILAHEIGHILLGHLDYSDSLLDMDDPLTADNLDAEETDADRAAFVLLTGRENPQVLSDTQSYNATQLAHAAESAAGRQRIEPAILALCLGHATGNWRQTFGALKMIKPGAQPVGDQINELAANQFDWQTLSLANRDYLAQVIGRGGNA
jgi:Zn-dependent peptidase ImmA (M78 family)